MAIKRWVRHQSGYGTARSIRVFSNDPEENYQIEPYLRHTDSDSNIEHEVPADDVDSIELGRPGADPYKPL